MKSAEPTLSAPLFPRLTGWRGQLYYLLLLVLLCTAIGTGLWLGNTADRLRNYLISANAIGLSLRVFASVASRLSHGWLEFSPRGALTQWRLAALPWVLLTTAASLLLGFQIATWLGVPDLPTLARLWRPGLHGTRARVLGPSFANSFVIATLAVYLFGTAYRSMRYRSDLEIERRRAAELLQAETAARLALLQAQIEPHFLFNTLANVQSLIKRQPDAAEAMLDSLNRYLRASLGRTRQAVSSLQQEIELVQALLSIAALRLGPRLTFEIDVPPSLRDLPLPPLLLQPLVENALLHGIEPSIAGGAICVTARAANARLTLRVEDSGVGLNAPACAAGVLHHGVGLANVRARLASLYGDAATLEVANHARGGVTAELVLPLTQSID